MKWIERYRDVSILYACESGSRAWGFQSADSDYDVRFIYSHPPEWYLSIEDKRDVIELMLGDTLDFSGWDVRKALKLFRKSNPPLMEWLRSPIVYMEQADFFAARLRDLADTYFSPQASAYHYLHMARGNFRDYLQGGEVWTKKYFYVLRPLLAVLWILGGHGPVPVEFEALLYWLELAPEFRQEVGRLLEAKRAGAELGKGPRNEVISQFIEAELERLETDLQGVLSTLYKQAAPYDKLDALFRDAIYLPLRS